MDEMLSDLTNLRGRYEQEVAEVRGAEHLTQEAKDERIRDLTRDFTSANARETAEVEDALEQRHRRLYRAAHAPEEPDGDVQAALLREMRRERVERDLTDRWERRGAGPTVEEYEEVLLRGDDLELTVYETLGPRRIGDAMRRQAVSERMEEGRRGRMSPERRRALEELEGLEKERAHVGYVLALRKSTMGPMLRGNMQGSRVAGDEGTAGRTTGRPHARQASPRLEH